MASQDEEMREDDEDTPDPLELRFGRPREYMDYPDHFPNVEDARARFQRRRDLAEYGAFPEGFVFEHNFVASDGERFEHNVTLLTPPDLIAVQAPDGTWSRRARNMAAEPPPYDQAWYENYLLRHHLPDWYLSYEHLSMINDDAEARSLQERNEPTDNAPFRPHRDYLDTQYPAIPYNPVLTNAQRAAGGAEFHIHEDRVPNFARRFPAVDVNAANGDRVIFVHPSGHISIRQRTDEEVDQDQYRHIDNPTWSYERLGQPVAASYDFTPREPTRSQQEVTDESHAAFRERSFARLERPPNGPGEWTWLRRAVDEPLARAQNRRTLARVVTAQLDGTFDTNLVPVTERPIAVWTPAAAIHNPAVPPMGPGHWAYLSSLDQELVDINLGGRPEYGFARVPNPLPAQVANLRRLRQINNDLDPTANFNLVWIPEGTGEHDGQTHSDNERAHAEGNQDIDETVRDPQTLFYHNPINRVESDQTGNSDTRLWNTRKIDRRFFTVDRSVAKLGEGANHKLKIVTKSGNWSMYSRKDKVQFDWDNKDHLRDLNRWRDQGYSRHEWPKKREDPRAEYPADQQKWVFNEVKGNFDNTSKAAKDKLYADFRKKFGAAVSHRRNTGIESLARRMSELFKKNPTWQESEHRGGKKKAEKEKRLREEEGEGEEDEQEAAEEEEEEESRPAKTKKKPRGGGGGAGPSKKRRKDDGDDEYTGGAGAVAV